VGRDLSSPALSFLYSFIKYVLYIAYMHVKYTSKKDLCKLSIYNTEQKEIY
jgi:hypothetical protein